MIQNLSIRIPYKDNGYTGLVCNKPCNNICCTRLKNIAENKKIEFEEKLKGKTITGNEDKIPCLSEGGCFMSETDFVIEKKTSIFRK